MSWISTYRLLATAALVGWLFTSVWLCVTLRRLHQARHDALTGVLTRAAWHAHARRCLGPTATLGLLDVDGLKTVNDLHGHHAGDEVLRVLATRLTTELGKDAVIGRLGGDEFVLLSPTTPTHRQLDALVTELTHPIRLSEQDTTVRVGVALGMAPTAPRRGQSAARVLSDALRAADVAMYRAKKHPEHAWLWTRDQPHLSPWST
ncbi:diguanylate cyclase (GGDEF) domain-containing protein [Actinopolyspora xinjiangensis]|uniref:Diguanylate cyclase (GGDEF) domain-containing protein n=1 Tax=Actinopolyspora xinjiangensis TaxID=405564 RepID=A0A1H0X076_9ACTN|nr:GGDEF domain-containing protein [Actinopolyspora xinjiangensis]SDP96368.1 diguanylate cyclase (GGDEF) domain-containing protein [Actinopolyspora xinjiangensis]